MNSSRKFQNDLTANKPADGKDVVSSEVSGDPKSKKPNGKSVDSSAEPLCSMIKKGRGRLNWRSSHTHLRLQRAENDHTVGSSMESWKMQSKSGFPEAEYPGDDIPGAGAGAVTTKLSQGVTREAPKTSIGDGRRNYNRHSCLTS
ncbi:unnamed protein product [Brassica napus]|uniref:(rape) hypothetical protein n=1 Tax=Brassica napus TaxID=3708 RepID=A0A816JZ86_BRANA|nr:unnamed protein product [Brassica napus]